MGYPNFNFWTFKVLLRHGDKGKFFLVPSRYHVIVSVSDLDRPNAIETAWTVRNPYRYHVDNTLSAPKSFSYVRVQLLSKKDAFHGKHYWVVKGPSRSPQENICIDFLDSIVAVWSPACCLRKWRKYRRTCSNKRTQIFTTWPGRIKWRRMWDCSFSCYWSDY